MATLMLHREVLANFTTLPQQVQRKIVRLIDEFPEDPWAPAIGLHALPSMMVDSKVRGADLPNGYRAIIIAPDRGDTFLMMRVDKHDAAYEWARNKHFEVHPETGVFQVFDLEEVQAHQPPIQPEYPSSAQSVPSYTVSALTDQELFHAGVPALLIPSIRALTSDLDLDALAPYLPPDCRDVLRGIAAGMSLDQALEEALGGSLQPETPLEPGDFSQLPEAPSFDLVLIKGEEHLNELMEALKRPLWEWRVFLHPSQRKLVDWNVNGPMSVNGAAGTGKTVVLMHRAVRLARELQQPAERVLVTTYSTTLASTLTTLFQQLDPMAARRIEVTHLHYLARTLYQRAGGESRVGDLEELEAAWQEVLAAAGGAGLPLSFDEIRREYELVVEAGGIDDKDGYLAALRTGRPRLMRQDRERLWAVFLEFRRHLASRSLMTPGDCIHFARQAAERTPPNQYRYVLVDETQDFNLEALRLLRAVAPREGQNPICLVGDGHQRIRRVRAPLGRAGLDVRGRSRRLKVNYRTTEEIRLWAHSILTGQKIEDLNGDPAEITGDRSVMHGHQPILVACANEAEEADRVASWVRELIQENGINPHEICITPDDHHLIRGKLQAMGIATFRLQPRQPDLGPDDETVRIGSMERIKGLEFKAVAMACFGSDALVNPGTGDLRDRCELYVAATRARERLLVTTRSTSCDG